MTELFAPLCVNKALANKLVLTNTDMLTPEELVAEPTMEFEPAEFSKTSKVLAYKLVERNKPQYEKFGGLTFFERWEKLESEIVRDAPPTVYESFRLNRSYANGIGLSIIFGQIL